MDLLVQACDARLSRLDDALLKEFELAMDMTFMPYIRTQLEIFHVGGGFSALPGLGMPDTNDSGVAATSTYTDIGTPSLGNPGSLPASALADFDAMIRRATISTSGDL